MDRLLAFVGWAMRPDVSGSDTVALFFRRWITLPRHLRTRWQLAGRAAVACGATHSIMERCNFSCTSCYLSDVANRARPLPFPAVREQLDSLRSHLGEGGKVQITSGEVTLLPSVELGRVIAYARLIGLDPMIMTNGQRLLQSPGYLHELVDVYGLQKISVHIDTTQRGRPGMGPGARERDLHPLRDRFARMIREVRKGTGKTLHGAQTVTVTPANLGDIPDIVHWSLANADAFRIVSFLPVADVGRTEDHTSAVSLDRVWDGVCAGIGRRLNRRAILFGHPECNITVPLIAISGEGALGVVELVREGKRWDAGFAARSLERLVPHYDFNLSPHRNFPRLFSRLILNPMIGLEAVAFVLYRLWGTQEHDRQDRLPHTSRQLAPKSGRC